MKQHYHHHRTLSASLSSSCDPGPNKTLLTIGQDFFSIEEYILSQYNASLHRKEESPSSNTLRSFHPAATMVYTDIQSLRGIDAPVDYGSGIEYAQGLAEAFPDSGIQIGLWLNGTSGCRDVVEGASSLDENIHKLYASIASWKLPKVFLRVGYEFDNPYFGYSEDPSFYRKAFRKMVEACETQLGYRQCHSTIAFCWHSWAAPRWIPSLDDFYPGDDVVDWVGISIFQQLYPWALDPNDNDNDNDNDNGHMSGGNDNDFAGGSMTYVKEVLEFARRHDKPVMIAESTPFGGMFWNGKDFSGKQAADEENTSTIPLPAYNNSTTSLISDNIWSLWFAPVLQLIDEYDIRLWSYINCDWDSQPMWHNIGFGDTRLASSSPISSTVMKNWWEQVLQNPRFVMAPLLCSHTGKETSMITETNTGGGATTIVSSSSSSSSTALVPPMTIFGSMSSRDNDNNMMMGILLPALFVVTLVVGGVSALLLLRIQRHHRGHGRRIKNHQHAAWNTRRMTPHQTIETEEATIVADYDQSKPPGYGSIVSTRTVEM